jgi:hypothetical protein
MKYIKLKCDHYDCQTKFLIAMNDWYIKEHGNIVDDYYICPVCESVVFILDDCLIDI